MKRKHVLTHSEYEHTLSRARLTELTLGKHPRTELEPNHTQPEKRCRTWEHALVAREEALVAREEALVAREEALEEALAAREEVVRTLERALVDREQAQRAKDQMLQQWCQRLVQMQRAIECTGPPPQWIH